MENENTGYEETLTPQDTDTEIDLDIDLEDETDYKSEADKAKELANNQKIRAEKAEAELKKLKSGSKEAKADSVKEEKGLSTIDVITLTKANVDIEDIDEVTRFARYQNLTISDALKSTALKAILAEKNEKRNVAQASHVGTSRRSSSQTTDETLLSRVSKGELPDSESEIKRLNALRWGIKG